MITEATLKAVKYGPEMLPDARVLPQDNATGYEVLDLRRFAPKWLNLTNIEHQYSRGAQVVKTDSFSFTELNEAAPWEAIGSMSGWFAAHMQFHAAQYLHAAVTTKNPGDVDGMGLRFNLWVYEPTVADKLARGAHLNGAERELANRLGLRDTVQKGLLPLPFDYAITREYPVLNRVTYTYASEANAGTIEPLHITAKPGEFLVIRSLSMHDNGAVVNASVTIDRDDDVNYLSLSTVPMTDWHPMLCFVPAMKELRVQVTSAFAWQARISMQVDHVRLTNIHRVRFGLVTRDEVPGELWDKVKGGVL